MKQQIYKLLNKLYAYMLFISFFAGFLPVVPFVFALIIGGETGRLIYSFLFDRYFVWVIALGSLSVVVGLVAMYIGKMDDLSLKSIKKSEKADK